jgi:AAA+ ATPase superfamily predicted ATPase
MIIGRKKEIEILNSICEESKSSFVSIYGRRRIGKTYLVDQFFKSHRKEALFFDYTGAYQLSNDSQIKNFLNQINLWFKQESQKEITCWNDAFNYLTIVLEDEAKALKENQKIVIFIDEVQWIDPSGKNEFLGSLGYFWNSYCEKKGNVILIICGSNASWINNKIFQDSDGPFNRRTTKTIPMLPFNLQETKEYLQKEKNFLVDDKTVIDTYMVFGGVAKYLSYLDNTKTIAQNIDELFFNINGELYGEYEIVFRSLFRDRFKMHKSIMDLLISKRSGFNTSEIVAQSDFQMGSKLKTVLVELEQCGFIQSIAKFNDERDTRYIASDPFSIFYNKWIEPYSKNKIAKFSKGHWSEIQKTTSYSIWAGFSFETICLINIDLYLKARGTNGVYKNHYYWQFSSKNNDEKGAQIDFVVEYGQGLYDIVECKYYNDEYALTQNDVINIKNKLEKFITHGIKKISKYELKLVFVSSYGLKMNQYYNRLNITSSIQMEELLNAHN